MVVSFRQKEQMAFDEEILDDPQLLTALETWAETRPAVRRHSAAKKQIAELRPQREGRFRVGRFLLDNKQRSGGDTHIVPWARLVSHIRQTDG
jgi:hypothetical protein